MTVYAFDMDGTLTPARRPMEEGFARRFLPWLRAHRAYVITGSDLPKVREQAPHEVLEALEGIFCSMGNVLWQGGREVYRRDFVPQEELLSELERLRAATAYPHALYPGYLEKRTGMLNFSIVGRECPYDERLRYRDWDDAHGERRRIRQLLTAAFPDYDVSLGGDISVDIVPRGCGKGQVAARLHEAAGGEDIVFCGDRTFEGGNDHDLMLALQAYPRTRSVQVTGPGEVAKLLGI